MNHRDIPEGLRRNARRLRSEMTEAERRLWYALRARRLDGLFFRRQVPIGPYIVDFACHDIRLVIELDGDQHGWAENEARESERTTVIEAEGYFVLRFWNFEVRDSFDAVLERIRRAAGLAKDDGDYPSPCPSPTWGEGTPD